MEARVRRFKRVGFLSRRGEVAYREVKDGKLDMKSVYTREDIQRMPEKVFGRTVKYEIKD